MRNVFKKKNDIFTIVSPVDGETIRLEDVADNVFNTKMLGDGVAFKLSGSTVHSPCDGVVTLITPTKHAYGILSNGGVEILVHIGLDTVNLNGKGFRVLVNEGDRVKKGEVIVEIDRNFMEEKQMDLTTPLVITNSVDYNIKVVYEYGNVEIGNNVLEVRKK